MPSFPPERRERPPDEGVSRAAEVTLPAAVSIRGPVQTALSLVGAAGPAPLLPPSQPEATDSLCPHGAVGRQEAVRGTEGVTFVSLNL